MNIIYKTIIICIFFSQYLFGQEVKKINSESTLISLSEKNDTIDFLIIDTVLNQKKPVFLFCQGSLPRPLYIEFEEGDIFCFGGGISNFDIASIKNTFHLVVISMPKTPVYCKVSELSNSMCFITDKSNPNSFLEDYLRNDYLENYVNRAEKVLKFLKKQDWVDNQKLVVFGHSQGSKIATHLATNKNNNITHVGLSGANPFGRVDQSIRQIRKDELLGNISHQDAEAKINIEYERWKSRCNPELRDKYPFLISWYSFSQPTINKLLEIKIPIYMTYGTEDITSDLCDLVPLLFIQHNKDNLTIRRQWGLEHNYFEVDGNKNMIVEKGHWVEVMNEFLEWTKN